MSTLKVLRPTLPILIGASLMLTLSMGLRQSLGIFVQPLTRDVGISVSDFTLAIAAQNLVWGLLQPLTGGLAVRYGFRTITMVGAVSYVAGLALMATAHGLISIMVGAGVLIGASLACTASAMAQSVSARAVPESARSTVLGIVSASGSLGALLSAPLGQVLISAFSWRTGLVGFVALAVLMIPAALYASRVDKLSSGASSDQLKNVSAGAAVKTAFTNVSFLVMTIAFLFAGCNSRSSRHICLPISQSAASIRC